MCTFDIFTPFSPEIRLLQRIHLGGSSVILVSNLLRQVDKNISVVFLKMAFTYLYHFENKLRLNENNYLWICLPYCNTGVSKRKSKCCHKIYFIIKYCSTQFAEIQNPWYCHFITYFVQFVGHCSYKRETQRFWAKFCDIIWYFSL